jgi:hypothetical protein
VCGNAHHEACTDEGARFQDARGAERASLYGLVEKSLLFENKA